MKQYFRIFAKLIISFLIAIIIGMLICVSVCPLSGVHYSFGIAYGIFGLASIPVLLFVSSFYFYYLHSKNIINKQIIISSIVIIMLFANAFWLTAFPFLIEKLYLTMIPTFIGGTVSGFFYHSLIKEKNKMEEQKG
ncbi:MAG: hypothetical protein CMH25_03845 [Micavibrio sp.]|nr:hypothetical protein [Micavibrio sp.]|tara:strand:+ start:259 stop:666 length:408 start_codon:yes stop_codon:yes gene_type:complete